jgi:tetratricopeptide (TPR) repeat protein
MTVVFLLQIAACNSENVNELKYENKRLADENAVLVKKRDELSAKLSEAIAEIEQLKQTDQYHYSKAVDYENSQNWKDAILGYQLVIDKYPNSPLIEPAKLNIDKANAAIRQAEKEIKVACQKTRKKIASISAIEAVQIIDEFVAATPDAPCVDYLNMKKDELAAMALKQQEQMQALNELGMKVSDFRTYWTIDPDGQMGKELLVPYIRFTLKNIGNAPIPQIFVKASFELIGEKKILGEGQTYVIVNGDVPLNQGYSREVFLSSTTGYTGIGILLGRPETSADIYINNRLVKTIKIDQGIQ